MPEVIIRNQGIKVGSVVFDEHPSDLIVERTATGFNLTIPTKISLKSAPVNEPRFVLKDLCLILYVETTQSQLEIGRLYDSNVHSAFVTQSEPDEQLVQRDLVWSSTLPAIFAIEHARKGNEPKLHARLKVNLCEFVIFEGWQNHGLTERRRFSALTEPSPVSDQIILRYPVDVWNRMVTKLWSESTHDPFYALRPLCSFLRGG